MESVIEVMMKEEQDSNLAAEELRMKLNALIASHRLSGEAALHLLARLSAGYIRALQRSYDQQGVDAVVEEDFQMLLTIYLTSLDMSDVMDEVEKIKKENLN